MRYPSALVLSDDPVVAALVGSLVELAEFQLRFIEPGEAIRNALRRVRPALILADCDHGDAGSDAFIGPALMIGAGVALFCSASGRARERTRATADRHGLAFFVLPDEADELQQWVASVAAVAPRQGVRRGA